MKRNIFVIVMLAALAIGGVSFSVQAQQATAPNALIDALARCLDITEDPRRLACSDAAGRALVDASRKRDVVVVDRDAVKATRRSLFGFTLPHVGLFGRDGPDKAEDIVELDDEIVAVATLPYGRYSLTMKGGARWNTTEEWTGATVPRAGAMLNVKRGAMGGYFVKLGGGRPVRALRVG